MTMLLIAIFAVRFATVIFFVSFIYFFHSFPKQIAQLDFDASHLLSERINST